MSISNAFRSDASSPTLNRFLSTAKALVTSIILEHSSLVRFPGRVEVWVCGLLENIIEEASGVESLSSVSRERNPKLLFIMVEAYKLSIMDVIPDCWGWFWYLFVTTIPVRINFI
ncbi:unnamed protein product [Ambrosiozyma monospora]|uniref:Unnamed protein product n=1 Tax=Ambrosiozyma monospora TaxID=43982 RepID=A0ACB5U1S7_AMBMO|nr:unnamed protein product [Ambrosiozyma monospora]